MLKLNHKNLAAWKKSIALIKEVYKIKLPKEETYGITNQIRRASISIASNIAEKASRSSLNERRRFYQIARSSLVEVDTQIEICIELGFLAMADIKSLDGESNSVFALLTAMVKNTK